MKTINRLLNYARKLIHKEPTMKSTIKAQIDWKDIKIGDKYHVPPYDDKDRMDIEIIFVNNYFFTFKTKTICTKYYASKDELLYRLMVKDRCYEHKKQQSVSQGK